MKYSIFLVLLVLLTASCQNSSETTPPPSLPDIPFRVDGTLDFLRMGEPILSLDIEVADTDSLRERGMMQRTSFPPESGMLFVFDTQEPPAILDGQYTIIPGSALYFCRFGGRGHC